MSSFPHSGTRDNQLRTLVNLTLNLPQLDGTLIEASKAAEVPVKTFANGPTNSMRGASFLSESDTSNTRGNESVIVVDVGGTTTDVGVLLPSGFPRKAAAFSEGSFLLNATKQKV